MSNLTRAIISLRPGVDFSNTNGTLEGIRWDTPNVTPPTQEEVGAEILALNNPPELTAAQKFKATTGLTVAQLKALVSGGK